MSTLIDGVWEFQGGDRYLSNFWLCPVKWRGIDWPSSENAYQGAKTQNHQERMRISFMSPGQSKKYIRRFALPKDWTEIKQYVMYDIVKAKFTQNPELAQKLMETGGLHLEEGNTWNDRYWGVCPPRSGNGINMLGKILMRVREELRQ